MTDGWHLSERGTWVKSYGKPRGPVARADLATPSVIGDGMDPVQHVDGNFYESKSAFRAITKREGYIEIGNDPARLRKPERVKGDPKARRQAVEKAVEQVLGA